MTAFFTGALRALFSRYTLAAMTLIIGCLGNWFLGPWLAIGGLAATIAAAIVHTFNYNRDYYIPAETVASTEEARTEALAKQA